MNKLLLFLLLLLPLGVFAQPARVIIIRHGEKPADESNPHLNAAGIERANNLGKWLDHFKANTNEVFELYAARPTPRGRSVRCLETLEPTAQSSKLKIQTPWPAAEYALLARDLLRDKELQGRTVVICWVHDEIPELAQALGVDPKPKKWKDADFDTAYVITFKKGAARLKYKTQK